MTRHVVCRLDEIPEGQARGFEPFGGWEPGVIVVRRGGAVFAYRNSCPHAGTPLDWTPDRFMAPDGTHLICATHGALFRVEDGHCVAGPCVGDRLERLGAAVEDGQVVVWEE